MALQEDADLIAYRVMDHSPFENAVRGVAVREEFAGDEDCVRLRGRRRPRRGLPGGRAVRGRTGRQRRLHRRGQQERYGSKNSWQAARR